MYRLRKLGKKERKLLGVCGGLSRYIDPTADPVIIRIIWVILTAFNPVPMIIIYLILAMVLKNENYEILDKYPILDKDLTSERNEKIKEAADEQRKEETKKAGGIEIKEKDESEIDNKEDLN